jgi:hypothetical protein
MASYDGKPLSRRTLFDTELLALIEYVRMNRLQKNVDTTLLQNALHNFAEAIWQAEEMELMSKGYDEEELNARMNELNSARAKEQREGAWNQVMTIIVEMLGNPSDDDLYTRQGNVINYIAKDKSGPATVERLVTIVHELPAGVVHFMPKGLVENTARKMFNKGVFDEVTESEIDKAAYELINTPQHYLCNYNMGPVEPGEQTAIYGSKLALEELVRVKPIGVLRACGIHDCKLSMVKPGYSESGYKIVLSPKNTAIFREQMENRASILRQKGILLTSITTVQTTSSEEKKPTDDKDDEASQQNHSEANQTEMAEYMKEQMVNQYQEYQTDLNAFITRVVNAIKKYKSIATNIGKAIPNPAFDTTQIPSQDDDAATFAKVNLIADFTLGFAKAYGVELPTKTLYYSDSPLKLVDLGINQEYGELNGKVSRNLRGGMDVNIHKLLTTMLAVLRNFWMNVEQKLLKVYNTLSPDKAVASEKADGQSRRSAIWATKYTLPNGIEMPLCDLFARMKDYVDRANDQSGGGSLMTIPPFALRPFENLSKRECDTWSEDDIASISNIARYVSKRMDEEGVTKQPKTTDAPATPNTKVDDATASAADVTEPDADNAEDNSGWADDDDMDLMMGAATRMF